MSPLPHRLGSRAARGFLVLGGLLIAAGAAAVSFEQRWGLESSRAALIAGREIPELDQALDSQRVIDSTITYAEKQGTYRAKLKTQPTCYDPSQPERMPWYVAPHYEWRERELVNTSVYFAGGAKWGGNLTYGVDFANGTATLIDLNCAAPTHTQMSAGLGSNVCDLDSQSPPNERILDRELREEVSLSAWNYWHPPEFFPTGMDTSIYHYEDQLPSCANGLTAQFTLIDDVAGCNTRWTLAGHWTLSIKITVWELWDVTPELYPDCFYPGRYYERDESSLPELPDE